MARASSGVRTSNGTTAEAAYELIAPAGKGFTLREIMITLAAATASTYGLGRPAAKGITPTTPANLLLEGAIDESMIRTATAVAWGTKPTVPAAFYRRVSFPATISSSILWVFPKGIFVPAGASIILWNLATNGVVDVTAVVDE